MGQSLTGLWTGALSNDSNTVRKEQSFEIALTEYRGKVFGYSRSEFIVDDTIYYVVKRVKGVIDGDICEVTDDDIIAYNFRGKLDKGIKVTSIFRRNQNDSTWYLDGTWKTNATKKYYAVTGKVNLAEEKDLTASKIFPHLEELKLADEVAFYKDRKEGVPVVKIVKPEKRPTNYSGSINNDVALNPSKPQLEIAAVKPSPYEEMVAVSKNKNELSKTDVKQVEPGSIALSPATPNNTIAEAKQELIAVKKPGASNDKTGTNPVEPNSVLLNPATPNNTIAEAKIPEQELIAVKKPGTSNDKTDTKEITTDAINLKPGDVNRTIAANPVPANTKPASSNAEPVTIIASTTQVNDEEQSLAQQVINKRTENNNQPSGNQKGEIVANKNISTPGSTVKSATQQDQLKTKAPTISIPEKPIAEITAKTSQVAGRKSEFSQVVSFRSDSLELALYDNGEIDGDTVSIYLDGEVIMARQGLKSSAIRKTIHIKPGQEDFTLVLFADNLGKYPPNTGLLVVRDGEDVYNLRFSSDFQKNAGIVFRRKH